MTLDDFRAIRDSAQQDWRSIRDELDAFKQQVNDLYVQMAETALRQHDAHEKYRDAKELFKVARDFKSKSVEEARMILKLRDGDA